ncbi:aldehyde dehydrogenase [Paenibacillus doosanensis]|uniref:Lactaldehyde dehydrogenase n=1 Tax=Paenibacillus konkukensis TaxID=2020716 RepID=A0ABY4RIG8_9BACL|nr:MULTISPECIES: aldehyde dehydrogenase [Paenibacillus]MCS7463996.1 aldehyde dehydrogenase [Paenibacillus doosanensis]UQZ81409.1 Lactaldehyde dehydrogenase [Paenibacillus konkukensis]
MAVFTEHVKTYELYINGEFRASTNPEMLTVTNPATGNIISQVPNATIEETREAIAAAEAAQRSWEKLPAVERGRYLRQISQKIRENAEELALTISREQGKILSLATVEVHFTADYIDYMAEWARRYEGEIIQSDRPNEQIFMFKSPIGVVSGILPWNFPFFLIARKLAPALITGNTIVVKPSAETPNNAFEFAKLVAQTDLPKGVFNLVSGRGSTVGQELSSNPKIGMVSFTGSVETGSRIMAAAAENIIKVSLELGGKAPAIVMDDADLDLAVESVKNSRIINTGQVCNCVERVYVHERIAEQFIERLGRAMSEVTYGDPIAENVDMGPLVSEQSLASVEAMVNRAIAEGAQVVTGGKRSSRAEGYYYEPTVLVNVKQDSEIMQKEIFGPVVPVMTFRDLDEAIELANDSEFGLTSSIYTQNLDIAMRACREIKFGETYINRENFEAIQGFHNGWRKSGIGGADGRHGLEEFLQTRVVYLQYDLNKK